jgi:arylsulfatase A-like enzyme
LLKIARWFPYLDNKLAGMEIGHGFALWEHLVRVPLVVSGPNVPTARVDDQVRHVDLLPTILDLCGIDTPPGIDGRNLRPLMSGETLPDEPAYLEAVGVRLGGNRIVGARTPEFKYLRPPRGKPALYSLDGGTKADEKRNVFHRYPEVARSLEAYVDRIAETEVQQQEGSGMTSDEEAVVEQHLRDLGYL